MVEKYVENEYQVFGTIQLVLALLQRIWRRVLPPNTAELKESLTIEHNFERAINPIEQ